jgi:hypothetical protein
MAKQSSNKRYRVNIDYLAELALPALLRKPVLKAWLKALLQPLRQLYTTFLLYAEACRIELSYSSITIVLEGALNDQFDPTAHRIIIDNSESELDALYINFLAEQQPPKYILFAAESPPWVYCFHYAEFTSQIDFTVHVPALLQTPQRTDQLNARIRHFKPATRRYALYFDL